jgi:hypothetical protein
LEILKGRADTVATEVGNLTRVISIKQGNLDVIQQHIDYANAVANAANGTSAKSS